MMLENWNHERQEPSETGQGKQVLKLSSQVWTELDRADK